MFASFVFKKINQIPKWLISRRREKRAKSPEPSERLVDGKWSPAQQQEQHS